ncbi:hypothetical protein V5799_029050, partial [Amblyomma americanum]
GDVASLEDVDGLDMWRHLSTGAPSPRTEMLYNIHSVGPESSVAAVRTSQYKLVLDKTAANSGRYPTAGGRRPHDDLDQLLAQSTTATVLRDLYKTDSLRFPRGWRQRATLTCGQNIRENFAPGDGVFLFDIIKDPCELNNLADSLPEPTLSGGDVASLGDVDGLDMWEHLSTGAPSPRTEMLYNTDTLDPKSTVTAIRNSRYKLVLDRTEEDNGRYPTAGGRRPHNDLDRLLVQSTAAAVLRDLYKTDRLRFPRSWRRRATLMCGRSIGKNFSPDDAVFLFDIIKDPCELNNLAESLPERKRNLDKHQDVTAQRYGGADVTSHIRCTASVV